jgi:hypothetical protein
MSERQGAKQMSLFGSDKPARQGQVPQAQSVDEQAISRYRYMLKTAPPETIEQAHAEAFAQLTPEQRRLVLQKITDNVPGSERALAEQSGANPQALARMATRAEIRQPGAMERMFGQAGSVSLGGVMAGTLLSSIAGTVIGSMIAREFFASESHGAAGAEGAAEPGQEAGFTDADQAIDDGDSFDTGGFDEA